MDIRPLKLRAVEEALKMLPDSGVIGLGSGSTAQLFIDGVAEAVRGGKRLVGVPTSEQSRAQAQRLGIPLLDDDGPWNIDLCVDGADEVSADLDLIKGGGACHLREKIVNQSARVNVIVVQESKLSQRLGEKWAVPVEIMPFGHASTARHLERFGTVVNRERDGQPLKTDTGNYVYDVRTGPIEDPRLLDAALHTIPGVVETGLFVGRAQVVIVAGTEGVRRIVKPSPALH